MRLFKTKPKALDPKDVTVVAPSSGAAQGDDVIDIDALMAQADARASARDDAAPVGGAFAQDVEYREGHSAAVAADTPPAKSVPGAFGRFMRNKGAKPEALATDATPSTTTGDKKVTLNWGTQSATPAPKEGLEPSSPAVADVDEVEESGVESYVPVEEVPTKSSRFKALTSRLKRPAGSDLEAAEAPIRVLVGFLPEVSQKDAEEFAMGVAGKHFDNLGLAFYDAFKLDNGYAYEAHEGGSGRAYLPEIVKYYKSLGAFNPEDDNKVVIRTGTRAVEVSRARNGLSAVLLPEEFKPPMPGWLKPTVAMRPAINKRTGVLVTGAVLFVTGFVAALTSGFMFRLQPYEAPVATKLEDVSYLRLPYSQWPQLQAQAGSQDRYVKALRYEKGAWRIETEAVSTTPPVAADGVPVPAPAPPAPAAAPALTQ